jgi:hypothetical protein
VHCIPLRTSPSGITGSPALAAVAGIRRAAAVAAAGRVRIGGAA